MDQGEWRRQVEVRKARPNRRRPAAGTQRLLLLETVGGGGDIRARLRALLPVARALVAGALGNTCVKEYIAHFPTIWTVEGQRRSPTMRVEYEHATVIGHMGEGLAAGKMKNWGPILGVFPLREDDRVDPLRLLYVFKDTSPYQKRFMQRARMRERMGPGFRRLVTRALRSTLVEFTGGLTPLDVVTMAERLGLGPRQFWRAAKGRLEIAVYAQRALFPITVGSTHE